MSHHIYETSGYIVGRTPTGEASAYFRIYTRDFGLITATAQGVRHLKSKLRYSLQEFSLSHISLVRGREVWRITNAREERNLFHYFKNKKPSLELISKIFGLVSRLVHGEGAHETLFKRLEAVFLFLESNELTEEDTVPSAFIANLKILDCLGYEPQSPILKGFIESPWSKELVSTMAHNMPLAKDHIERALRESHL